ncbi:hypothetical protein HN51_022068 [Arachis hypogaea]|uniref:Phytosulfokine n=1 Tax=Arachis hypogaea TaxID=3818 RepID=A0A445EDM1_ARAHY|nr:Phytosulfokines [Arachis hypogaea]RYR73527.1 hypothetical protein Ahy_A02g007909 [Arachis hypogaea]
MMSNKLVTFFITLVLLLSFISLIHASRPNFASLNGFSSLNKDIIVGTKEAKMEGLEEYEKSCDEGTTSDNEECLMRRTLVAHTDYIYTQKHHPKP